MKNKYIKFISFLFLFQSILSFIFIPQTLRDFLGGTLGGIAESVLLWIAPGRIIYKGGTPLEYSFEIIMIILIGNLVGLLIVATPIYFIFRKKVEL